MKIDTVVNPLRVILIVAYIEKIALKKHYYKNRVFNFETFTMINSISEIHSEHLHLTRESFLKTLHQYWSYSSQYKQY